MPGLKNTSDCKSNHRGERSRYSSWKRGIDSESLVIKHYQKNGYKVVGQRLRTPFAEVDLLFEHPGKIPVMVEVKTLNNLDFMGLRLGKQQRARLLRAHQHLSEGLRGKKLELHLAFVSLDGEILIIDDISG